MGQGRQQLGGVQAQVLGVGAEEGARVERGGERREVLSLEGL